MLREAALVAERASDERGHHAESLLVMLDAVLADAEVSLDRLGVFAREAGVPDDLVIILGTLADGLIEVNQQEFAARNRWSGRN